MKDKALNKAARYLIFRDKEVTINTILFFLLALFTYLLSIIFSLGQGERTL